MPCDNGGYVGDEIPEEKKVEEAPAENKPKVKWWKKVVDSVGNAIGEAKFGGR